MAHFTPQLVLDPLRLRKTQTHDARRKFRSGGLTDRANTQPPDFFAAHVGVLQLCLRNRRALQQPQRVLRILLIAEAGHLQGNLACHGRGCDHRQTRAAGSGHGSRRRPVTRT